MIAQKFDPEQIILFGSHARGNAGSHGDAVSFEYILEMQPDVLFVIDRASAIGAEGKAAAEILDNELVAQTPAWQNGRVVYVDSFAWYIAWTSLPAFFQVVEDVEVGLQ